MTFEYGVYSKTTRHLLRKGTVTTKDDGHAVVGTFDPPVVLVEGETMVFLHDGNISSWMPAPMVGRPSDGYPRVV